VGPKKPKSAAEVEQANGTRTPETGRSSSERREERMKEIPDVSESKC